ncbi:MAG: hypothetical protein DDT25_00972 [Chloroflexi bacterium]|nr:hypothetical protein [Chloroflexota bacterium]
MAGYRAGDYADFPCRGDISRLQPDDLSTTDDKHLIKIDDQSLVRVSDIRLGRDLYPSNGIVNWRLRIEFR